MRSPADQEPYGYPTTNGTPITPSNGTTQNPGAPANASRSSSSVDWLGLLGLIGLIGLAGLLPSRRTEAHRVVYHKRNRAA